MRFDPVDIAHSFQIVLSCVLFGICDASIDQHRLNVVDGNQPQCSTQNQTEGPVVSTPGWCETFESLFMSFACCVVDSSR